MKINRRILLSTMAGASVGVLQSQHAQGAREFVPACTGKVTNTKGGAVDCVLEVVGPDGVMVKDTTNGTFELPAPKNGPYEIVFRETKTKARRLAITQLTAGMKQELAVTINDEVKSFQSVYNSLQAIECLLSWLIAHPDDAATFYKVISFEELSTAIERSVSVESDEISARQREFLSAKTQGMQQMVKLVG